IASGRAVSPASSSSKVSVSMNGTPSVGSYVISDITSLATIASATSKNGYDTKDATAVAGGDHTIDLVVGGTTHTISLTESQDNLQDLAAAINSGDYGVRASIIDTGASSGRYHLALTSTEAGPVSLSLQTTGGEPDPELLVTTSAGSNAAFKINGQDVTSSTNSVSSVVEGLIFTLNETTSADETITISAQSSRNTLTAALESVATAYNSLRDAIDAQTGESAGALAGDRIIYEIQARMRSIVGVAGADGNGNLAKVGLTLGTDGRMTFDGAQLDAMGAAALEDAFAFLDNSPGSLGAFAAKLDQLSNAETGMMKAEIGLYDETDERLSAQIDTLSERVSAMQTTLFSQLQAADALLAELESQQSVLDASIESLYLVLYGKNDG
ncbi:MAG TPA: flagellar filament capping protein FliD, partial [Bryobacteraceae bacterium]|nr:flagellar filament capping protein FliD [Bryobacteraceae bacterium]